MFQGSKLWKPKEYGVQNSKLIGYIKECWHVLQEKKYMEYQDKLKEFQHFFMHPQEIINHLKSQDIKFIFTPYCQYTQLVYLHKNGYINAVLSEPSILAYLAAAPDLTEIIYDFDIKKNDFYSINAKEFIQETLRITNQQYQELAILTGALHENLFTIKPKPVTG